MFFLIFLKIETFKDIVIGFNDALASIAHLFVGIIMCTAAGFSGFYAFGKGFIQFVLMVIAKAEIEISDNTFGIVD